MEININQRKISFGDKYNIFIEKQPAYRAVVKLFSWRRKINLSKESGDEPLLTIKKRWSWPVFKYDILRNNSVLPFRVIKLLKRYCQCVDGNDVYDIYGQSGRKVSVYKNDIQIAWWDQNMVSWFNGDNYTITADKDADVELLIAFCLVIDDASSRNTEGNTVTIHLGSPWKGEREFDPEWRPKL
jgi:uncharacterized protein YxjI